MAKNLLAICLMFIVVSSVVYEVQGTFLLKLYLMRRFPKYCAAFAPFAIKGIMMLVRNLESVCPVNRGFQQFFSIFKSYISFINSVTSSSTNIDTEMDGRCELLAKSVSSLTGQKSTDTDDLKNTMLSMGKTLVEQKRQGSKRMTIQHRRELIISMVQWTRVIITVVKHAAETAGKTIDESSYGLDVDVNSSIRNGRDSDDDDDSTPTTTPSTYTPPTTTTPSTYTSPTTTTPSTSTPPTTSTPSSYTSPTTSTPSISTPPTTPSPSTYTPLTTSTPYTSTPLTTSTPSTSTPPTTSTPSTSTPPTTPNTLTPPTTPSTSTTPNTPSSPTTRNTPSRSIPPTTPSTSTPPTTHSSSTPTTTPSSSNPSTTPSSSTTASGETSQKESKSKKEQSSSGTSQNVKGTNSGSPSGSPNSTPPPTPSSSTPTTIHASSNPPTTSSSPTTFSGGTSQNESKSEKEQSNSETYKDVRGTNSGSPSESPTRSPSTKNSGKGRENDTGISSSMNQEVSSGSSQRTSSNTEVKKVESETSSEMMSFISNLEKKYAEKADLKVFFDNLKTTMAASSMISSTNPKDFVSGVKSADGKLSQAMTSVRSKFTKSEERTTVQSYEQKLMKTLKELQDINCQIVNGKQVTSTQKTELKQKITKVEQVTTQFVKTVASSSQQQNSMVQNN